MISTDAIIPFMPRWLRPTLAPPRLKIHALDKHPSLREEGEEPDPTYSKYKITHTKSRNQSTEQDDEHSKHIDVLA